MINQLRPRGYPRREELVSIASEDSLGEGFEALGLHQRLHFPRRNAMYEGREALCSAVGPVGHDFHVFLGCFVGFISYFLPLKLCVHFN